MRIFTRITAVIFIVIGLLIIFAGFWGIGLVNEITKPLPKSPFSALSPLFLGLTTTGITLKGLYLIAIGEGLWLLADIHKQNQNVADLLFSLRRKKEE